jgi:hypothetical protein
MPLDRAHAHARWAERYDAQGDTQRSAAHFGRAMHYAHAAQAFGAPKRSLEEVDSRDAREADSRDAREADSGHIVVGSWEGGEEAWYKLRDLPYPERTAVSRRMQQVFHGHGDKGRSLTEAAAFVGSAHRELPDLLDKLYESEISGTKDSVRGYTGGTWYIHRCDTTSIVYLVPALLAKDEDGVRSLVRKMRGPSVASYYRYVLSEGLLIVQDKRPGCVRVKRNGVWEAATEIETFAYYDFLLRYPAHVHNYQSEKKASESRAEMLRGKVHEDVLKQFTDSVTQVPAHMNASDDLWLTVKRDWLSYYIGNFDAPRSSMSQISDWAWRHTERPVRE